MMNQPSALDVAATAAQARPNNLPRQLLEAAQPSLLAWLAARLEQAGMSSLISHGAGLTLLAPSQTALGAWLDEQAHGQARGLTEAEALRSLFLDHLMPVPLRASALLQPKPLNSLGQALVRCESTAQGPMLVDACQQRARILSADMQLGALRVHLIDRVLLAPRLGLLETLNQRPELSDLAEAVERCGLDCVLRSQGPFTLFAPSNDALADLAARLGLRRRSLMADACLLLDVLRYHLVSGRLLFAEMPWGGSLSTAHGAALKLSALGQIGSADAPGQALLIDGQIQASNGVLHPLKRALLPPAR